MFQSKFRFDLNRQDVTLTSDTVQIVLYKFSHKVSQHKM
jgi:hypothetical protein